MSFKVVNTIHIPGLDFGEDLLKTMDAKLVNAPSRSESGLIEGAGDADAVICSGPLQPWTPKVLQSLTKCRIVASLGVGYDRIDLETATKCGIAVTNIPDYCIDEVSGLAITLIMALGRKLFLVDKIVREKQIHFVPPNRKGLAEIVPVYRMRDQTVGIIGLGKIGTATALKAKGLGMKVVSYDPHVYGSVMESLGITPVDFETLLAVSDFISINADLNEETRNMITLRELKKMKKSAYLVNTARGEIVEQESLIQALQEGIIAGAGLDVTADDPMSAENPMLKMDNVILTGHCAWYSTESDSNESFWHRAMMEVIQALKGEWPVYAVNAEVKKTWLAKWGMK